MYPLHKSATENGDWARRGKLGKDILLLWRNVENAEEQY